MHVSIAWLRKQADAAAKLAEEEEMAQRVEERVRARVEEALASPGVAARIEARLREERAALEQKVRAALCHVYPWGVFRMHPCMPALGFATWGQPWTAAKVRFCKTFLGHDGGCFWDVEVMPARKPTRDAHGGPDRPCCAGRQAEDTWG